MTKKILGTLNVQIKEEFYSAYLYLALSAKLAEWNFPGAASWMVVQAKEEVDHAMGFFRYLAERQEAIELLVIPKPRAKVTSVLECFEAGLEHEKFITDCIAKIAQMAKDEKDAELSDFIKWYIEEQMEEETSASQMIDRLKTITQNDEALKALDQEVSERKYHPGGPYANK